MRYKAFGLFRFCYLNLVENIIFKDVLFIRIRHYPHHEGYVFKGYGTFAFWMEFEEYSYKS